MAGKTLESRKPGQLKDHPLNKRVFGDPKAGADWGDFVGSVKASGVIEPLIITEANLILSGHRRKAAAVEAGLGEVPVIVRHDLNGDGLDADFAWFNANRQREKTAEQKARWYETLTEVEARAAKGRQASNLRQVQNVPNGENTANSTKTGKAKDIAAGEVGMDKRTADKAVAVVHAIDEAEAAGDTEKADDLRTTLNTKSVAAAHRKITGGNTFDPQELDAAPAGPKSPTVMTDAIDRPVPERLNASCSLAAALESLARKVDPIKREAESLSQQPGGDFVEMAEVNRLCRELKTAIGHAAYWTACPRCKGKSCDRCKVGWIPRCRSGHLSDDDKAALGLTK